IMSLTTSVDVFKAPRRGYYWSYYIITSSLELESALAHPLAQTYPVVLMFWASWNEPCRVMMRPFRAMAVAKRRAAIFCQVDVDKFKDIVERYRVEALPTFLLLKQGVEKGRVVGAKVGDLSIIIMANI
uniref:Thioredoxin domain-containing protein n=3 Tax=Aegilops tauschii TaxID=37682 RepID=A0A453DPY5_AEGTS